MLAKHGDYRRFSDAHLLTLYLRPTLSFVDYGLNVVHYKDIAHFCHSVGVL